MVEGVLLAALAGIAALGLARLVLQAGLAIFFMTLPPSFAAVARVLPLDVDQRVFSFTVIVAGLATLMFALVPALHGTRLTLALLEDLSRLLIVHGYPPLRGRALTELTLSLQRIDDENS